MNPKCGWFAAVVFIFGWMDGCVFIECGWLAGYLAVRFHQIDRLPEKKLSILMNKMRLEVHLNVYVEKPNWNLFNSLVSHKVSAIVYFIRTGSVHLVPLPSPFFPFDAPDHKIHQNEHSFNIHKDLRLQNECKTIKKYKSNELLRWTWSHTYTRPSEWEMNERRDEWAQWAPHRLTENKKQLKKMLNKPEKNK